MSIWQNILELDRDLFKLINYTGSSDILDTVLPFIRESQFWVPFYLFLLIFSTLNFGAKGWWWALGFILVAALCDITSSQLIKESIFRLRPCHNPMLAEHLIFRVKYCPKSSSFTSSHATTHFGLAMFLFLTYRKISKWWALIFIWPVAICYAQVYVGVHYPLDVVVGGVIGCIIGIA
ncbi:MAG TPA: phosphatase PAP2 family protein, partial [Chitinophagaceae bacterium]|nr:phosphatase PAP2 family protein [Chitinophagaceae bacterium]